MNQANPNPNPIEQMLGYPQVTQEIKDAIESHLRGYSAKGQPLTEAEAAFAIHVITLISYRIRVHQQARYLEDPFFQHAVHSFSTARDMLNQIYATQNQNQNQNQQARPAQQAQQAPPRTRA